MVIRRKDGPDGPEYYRPPYRPEVYTVEPTAVPVDPLVAYNIALERDRTRSYKVTQQ
jgi:hypothetical protein